MRNDSQEPGRHPKHLHLWLAVSAGVFTLYALAGLTESASAARGSVDKAEVFPIEKAAAMPVVVETTGSEQDLRAQMRKATQVNGLTVPVSKFSEAAMHSYGFIPPQPLSMALVMRSPDLMIEQRPATPNSFEIHKVDDGNGLLVGFVAKEMLAQLTAAQRLHTIAVSLHSNPSDKAPYIVAVPLIKLVVDRMPTRLDPSRPDGTMVLTVDLQGTTNRKKSLHGGQ